MAAAEQSVIRARNSYILSGAEIPKSASVFPERFWLNKQEPTGRWRVWRRRK